MECHDWTVIEVTTFRLVDYIHFFFHPLRPTNFHFFLCFCSCRRRSVYENDALEQSLEAAKLTPRAQLIVRS